MSGREAKRVEGVRSTGIRGSVASRVAIAVVVLAATGVLPVFVNHPIGYLPLVTAVFAAALGWMYLRVARRGFSVEAPSGRFSCVRGGSAEFPLSFVNGSPLPLYRVQPRVQVENPYGHVERVADDAFSLDGRSSGTVAVEVDLGHVGVYRASLREVVLFDPFGLFWTRVRTDAQAEVVSTPHQLAADSLALTRGALRKNEASLRTVLSDDIDYAGVREYVMGDPLKSIHWKISARAGELQTRLFESNIDSRVAIVMDFHAPDYGEEALMNCSDAVVESALAVGDLARRNDLDVRLKYVGRDGKGHSDVLPDQSDLGAFTRGLPPASPDVAVDLALDLVTREALSSGGSGNVILCTSSLDGDAVERMLAAHVRNANASLVLAVPRAERASFVREGGALLSRLETAGVPCFVISDAAELEVDDGTL